MCEKEDDRHCDNSGQCEAPSGARGITNCIYCDKELHEKNGEWFTWDAYMTNSPRPEGPVI